MCFSIQTADLHVLHIRCDTIKPSFEFKFDGNTLSSLYKNKIGLMETQFWPDQQNIIGLSGHCCMSLSSIWNSQIVLNKTVIPQVYRNYLTSHSGAFSEENFENEVFAFPRTDFSWKCKKWREMAKRAWIFVDARRSRIELRGINFS